MSGTIRGLCYIHVNHTRFVQHVTTKARSRIQRGFSYEFGYEFNYKKAVQ